jgi:hypothetical protein
MRSRAGLFRSCMQRLDTSSSGSWGFGGFPNQEFMGQLVDRMGLKASPTFAIFFWTRRGELAAIVPQLTQETASGVSTGVP